MKILFLLIFVATIILLISCQQNKPAKVVFAKQLFIDVNENTSYGGGAQHSRHEYYFIINPPRSKSRLVEIAENHHKSLSHLNDSIEENYDVFYRNYYKLPGKTEDFVLDENDGINFDYLETHKDDFVCFYKMEKKNTENGPKITWKTDADK